MHTYCFSILTAIILLLANVQTTIAAGQVQLDLVGDPRETALTFQQWGQALSSAGIKNVRLRSATGTDRVGIEVQGSEDHPLYIVTGKVISQNELQLPGARFKRGEIKRLAAWLDDLAQNGPPDKRPKIVALGLTAAQLDQAKKALAQPVDFSTRGLSYRDAVERIVRKLALPFKLEEDFIKHAADKKVDDELAGLSSGTVLACLLRSAGYGLTARASGRQIDYAIVKSDAASKESWPVGQKPDKPPAEILPGLFEFHNINVQNVPIAKVADAVGKRLNATIVYDRLALAKYNINPAKTAVNFPSARSNYSLALRRMLFSAGLKFDVRTDDAGTPFLWISTLKPL